MMGSGETSTNIIERRKANLPYLFWNKEEEEVTHRLYIFISPHFCAGFKRCEKFITNVKFGSGHVRGVLGGTATFRHVPPPRWEQCCHNHLYFLPDGDNFFSGWICCSLVVAAAAASLSLSLSLFSNMSLYVYMTLIFREGQLGLACMILCVSIPLTCYSGDELIAILQTPKRNGKIVSSKKPQKPKLSPALKQVYLN